MTKERPALKSSSAGGGFAKQVSDFLFRWRKLVFTGVLALMVAVTGGGIYSAVAAQQQQTVARTVYELRKAFEEWQEAHPESWLTAAQNLEGRAESIEIDEERTRAETEQTLNGLLEKNKTASRQSIRAWAWWIQARKARHLRENRRFQAALEQLLALRDETFHKTAMLHLAGLFYSEGKTAEALAQWRALADSQEPEPAQLVATVYLANYFARSGQKEEAIRYWQLLKSLGTELLQANGLDDPDSFLGGENLIVDNFRTALEQWRAMAENQLLFLESDSIQADSYDETIEPEAPQPAAPAEEAQTFSFTTGESIGLPGTAGQ